MNTNETQSTDNQTEQNIQLADLTVENGEEVKGGGAMAELPRKTLENAKTL